MANPFAKFHPEADAVATQASPMPDKPTGNAFAKFHDQESGGQQSWNDWFGGMARSVAQGITFNFADEMEAFVRARTGSGDYEAEIAKIRDEIDEFRKENPWASGIAEFAGGMILPGGVAVNTAKNVARGARGFRNLSNLHKAGKTTAKYGAGFGAAAGVGAGEDLESRAVGGVIGVGAGAGVGYFLPGAGAVVDEIGNLTSGALVRMGIKSADDAAEKTILKAAQKDASINNRDVSQEIQGMVDADAPIYGAGQTVRKMAEDAASFGGEAGKVAQDFAEAGAQRRSNTDDLLGVDGLAGGRRYDAPADPQPAWGGGDNFGADAIGGGRGYRDVMDEIIERRRAGMDSGYEQVYAQPPQPVPELDNLLRTDPTVRSAITRAARKAASYAEREGPPIRYVDVVNNSGEVVGQQALYSPRTMDYLSRELTNSQSAAQRAGRGQDAIFFGDIKDKLRPVLNAYLPDLGALQSRYAEESALVRAGEHGRSFKPNMTGSARDEWFDAFYRMGAEEAEVATAGVREAVRDTLRTAGDDRAVRRLADSADFERNLTEALGPDGFNVVGRLRNESDRIAGEVRDAEISNHGRSFRPTGGDRRAKDWINTFAGMTAQEQDRLLPGAREAVQDAIDKHGDLDKAIAALAKNDNFTRNLEAVFGAQGRGVSDRIGAEAQKIATEQGLEKAAQRGRGGRALIEEKDAAKVAGDIAVTTAAGFPIPVYLAFNTLKRVTGMDKRTAEAVLTRLAAMKGTGVNVEELAKRLAKLDSAAREKEMRRLGLSVAGASAIGQSFGEAAGEGRAAANRGSN